jgi:hypothetical protein
MQCAGVRAKQRHGAASTLGTPRAPTRRPQVCSALLPVLVRRPSLCQHLLQLDAWRQLASAFAAADDGMMRALHQKLHRALAKVLCMAAGGLQDEGQAQQYVLQVRGRGACLPALPSAPSHWPVVGAWLVQAAGGTACCRPCRVLPARAAARHPSWQRPLNLTSPLPQLLGGSAAALAAISQQPDLKASAGHADVQLRVRLQHTSRWHLPCLLAPSCSSSPPAHHRNPPHPPPPPHRTPQVSCLLERLRGSACATLPSTQGALFQVYTSLLQPLLALQEAFQAEGPLVTRLLKLASAVVENQVGGRWGAAASWCSWRPGR